MRFSAVFACLLALVGSVHCAKLIPNYQGCMNKTAKALPYCDPSLTMEERIADLIKSLTIIEKIALISPDPSLGSTCNMHTSPLERVGIPEYMWLVETNTAVASVCVQENQCATNFIGPEGLGASFNRTSWRMKGDVISTEFRALSNANYRRGTGPTDYIGLTGFGPNINIARDPRFGRNSELPGEDPFLSGHYAVEYVKGLQQIDERGFYKMFSYLKHYTAYSVESNRGHDTYNISDYDLFDTYLRQYEIAFVEGNASGVMCSYPAENGHPSCANDFILNTIMRGVWGAKDAVVMTDCGVVANTMGPPVNAATPELAAAFTINNGTDLEAGTNIWTDSMLDAVMEDLVSVETIDAAVRRTQLQLMQAGHYDDPENVSWTKISLATVNSTAHRQVNYEAALQSFVLLKNNGILPLTPGKRIAVIGPQGVTREGLLSSYHGDVLCFSGDYECIPMISEEIGMANVGGETNWLGGVDVNSEDESGIVAAIALAVKADVVVLVIGIDKTIEHEGQDRSEITLPGKQDFFAQLVLALGKPTVMVLTNGGALAIDGLIEGPDAIIEAFNPATEGARALAATLFGKENRWGKLPITLYPSNYTGEKDMDDYDMSSGVGRTYRYYTGTPQWPFGWGLSYVSFAIECRNTSTSHLNFECDVHNLGKMQGDEVIMVFHSAGEDIRKAAEHPVPLKSLVEFDRTTVAPGENATVSFALEEKVLSLTTKNGSPKIYSGLHSLIFSNGHDFNQVFNITV